MVNQTTLLILMVRFTVGVVKSLRVGEVYVSWFICCWLCCFGKASCDNLELTDGIILYEEEVWLLWLDNGVWLLGLSRQGLLTWCGSGAKLEMGSLI